MITTREIQVAELICWGQSEKDIARKPYLSKPGKIIIYKRTDLDKFIEGFKQGGFAQ